MKTLSNYILIFFMYCFVGWVWECCFCSVKGKRLINRGFCHGPYLPIYGTGGLIIIGTTYPVKENLLLTFLVGMVCCSALEYFTGAAMLKLFHVRYWDYSQEKLNLNGHIFWGSCLLWGFASVILMRFVFPPSYKLVSALPGAVSDGFALILVVVFTVDFTNSFKAALDFKALLEKIAEHNSAIENLKDRVERISDTVTRSTGELKEKMTTIENELAEAKQRIADKAKTIANVPESAKEYADKIYTKYAALNANIQEKVDSADDFLQKYRGENLTDEQLRVRREAMNQILDLKLIVRKLSMKLPALNYKDFRSVKSIFERNNLAVSPKYAEAFEEVKRAIGEKLKKGDK
ncbi:MAG: hypothetical protein Q4C42_08460 [Clostridia bacterium]|nr:hypothetical protein [Clostridia bacterium]